MEELGTIFGIIIAIIVIVSWVKNLDPKGNSSLQSIINRGLANVLGEQKNSADTSQVKIYDEDGNLINFQNSIVTNNSTQDVVIYDEDGNVMSGSPPPLAKKEPIPAKVVAQEAVSDLDETEEHASMYHDFIRSNGGSAIVIQEILGKPAALR